MSFDILQDKILALRNPTVVGLDPRPEYIPKHILYRHTAEKGETLEAAADAFLEFNGGLIDALCDIVPAVKPQSAFYELLGRQASRRSKRRRTTRGQKVFTSSETSSEETSARRPRRTPKRISAASA
jgi:hypothetical protein